MTSRVCAGLTLAVLFGCPEPTGTKDSETSTTTDSDTQQTPTGETGDSATTGTPDRVQVSEASATCDPKDVVTLYAKTTGFSQGGVYFLQETGNVEPQHTEVHDISSYNAAKNGSYDKLNVALTTGAKYVRNESTLFTCDGHFEAVDKALHPTVMTYIVLVYDDQGKPSDCMAYGHDPQGLLAGKYEGVVAPPKEILDHLGQCVIGKDAN